MLLLTGFLALVTPGRLFQLLCGLLVAFTFCCLHIYFAPYRTASNNLLAMAINFSLVLAFVSSISVKVNSEYGGDINPFLLSLALWASAFAVFPLTLLLLSSALFQRRIIPAQLRGHLLKHTLNEEPEVGATDAQLPSLETCRTRS